MTISEALKKYPKIESDLLLAHVLKKSKEFLYLHPSHNLTAKQMFNFLNMAKKRVKGMPAAYLLGYKYFYGLKFKVNKSVLIPRPESEWLVDQALKAVTKMSKKDPNKTLKIVDVGTGSGCLAVSVAKNTTKKRVKIYASDISKLALQVAKHNTKTHKVKINFSERDLTTGMKEKFDIIIANLPYVPLSDYKKFFKNLQFEPRSALTDSSDDFIVIRKFLVQVKSKLSKFGVILIETDPSSIKILKSEAIKNFPTKNVQIIKDIHGLERFMTIE